MKRRSRNRGFILFFGTRNIVSKAVGQSVPAKCPRCGQNAEMVQRTARQWFTLFFLPVFPIGAVKQFTQCSNCKASFNAPPQQLANHSAKMDTRKNEQAISMYNSLRVSPANSITLNELMQMYASMEEFDQAISAASNFPQALNNSEQCMATLGRIYLAKNETTEAIKWLDSATTRNSTLGEAQFFKAVAFVNSIPPNLDQAIASARAARSAGYVGADALLRDIEAKARA